MYLARWGGVGRCVLDRRVRARSEDPTHGNGEPRAKKRMAANFFPRFFLFGLMLFVGCRSSRGLS